jgi:hypothetical protein
MAKKLKRFRTALYYRLEKYPAEIALAYSKIPPKIISKRIRQAMKLRERKPDSTKRLAAIYGFAAETLKSYSRRLGRQVMLERLADLTDDHLFTYNGESHTISEWAAERHCSIKAMRCRLIRDVPEIALARYQPTVAKRRGRKRKEEDMTLFTYCGVSLTLRQWVKQIAVVKETQPNLRIRVRYKLDGEMLSIAALARKLGADYKNLYYEIQHR